jgi:hypothetical protein
MLSRIELLGHLNGQGGFPDLFSAFGQDGLVLPENGAMGFVDGDQIEMADPESAEVVFGIVDQDILFDKCRKHSQSLPGFAKQDFPVIPKNA